MPGYRIDRINSDIRLVLSELIPKLKDPRIGGMISIVRCEVSGDLSYAKVYVCSLEGIEGAKRACKGLTSASGYIRREVGSAIKLRKVPEFRFIADDSIEESARISQILNDFSKED